MVYISKEAQEGLIPQHGEMLISLMTIITMAMMTVMTTMTMAIMTIMMMASIRMRTKQPLFPDEGSGAEVVLRPGDSVIVRGASQLRGHLVGLLGHLNGEDFCALLAINLDITLKNFTFIEHLCMQLSWHLSSTLATFFLHYNPHFDTYTLAGC